MSTTPSAALSRLRIHLATSTAPGATLEPGPNYYAPSQLGM